MSVGILLGALVVGGTLVLAGGGKKKKKAPSTQDIAQTLAEKEAAGEIVVTDEGDVLPVESDPETEAIAQELAEKEAAGEIVVTDDGAVAEKVGPNSWTLPPNWFALFEVKPTGNSDALMQVLRSGVVSGDIYIIGGPTKNGNIKFASFDEEPSTFTAGETLTPDIPATLVELQLLSKAEFNKLVGIKAPRVWNLPAGGWFAEFLVSAAGRPQDLVKKLATVPDAVVVGVEADGKVRFVGNGDDDVQIVEGEIFDDIEEVPQLRFHDVRLITRAQYDRLISGTANESDGSVAQELAEAEAAGEIEVTESGDVIPAGGNMDQAAQALKDAEARGEVVVTDDGEVLPADASTESEEDVAQELAEAEARGEIQVSDSGEVAIVGPDQDAQALVDMLIDAERNLGSLWKAAHQAEIQAWQIQQGVDYQGKPMKPDGWFGRVGALTVASLGVDAIPLVRGWPKGSNQQTAVTEYKIALQNIKTADPEAVRVALLRERGQGYGTARAIPPSEQVG